MLAPRIPRRHFRCGKRAYLCYRQQPHHNTAIQCRNGANLTREDVWGIVLRAFRLPFSTVIDLNASVPSLLPAWGVSISVDADGNVLHAAIAWYDQRTVRKHSGGRISPVESASLPLRDIFHANVGVNKLLWLRNHVPQVFERIHHWLALRILCCGS